MDERVSELEADGIDIIDLSTGEPDLVAPEHVRDAAADALARGETDYTVSRGLPEFRDAIARKLRDENDLVVDRDDIIVTPGSKQALFEAIFSILNDGDEVVLPEPAWVSYEPMIKMAGGRVNRVSLDSETGFGLDGVDLESTISDETQLMVVNTPSISSAVFSRRELERIRDLAVDHDFWVLTDELYEKLVYDGEHHSIGGLDGMADRTVTVNGFSKVYAMAEDVIDEASKIQSRTVSCATTFSQYGGIAALEGPQEPIDEMRRTYRSRRDALVEELQDAGTDISPPEGAFYLFIPVDTDNDVALAEEVLKQEHVAIMPGSVYGVDNSIRLSYTADEEAVVEGVRRLKKHL
jgi:aspartate aminotransferase